MTNIEFEEKYISLRREAIELDFTHLNKTQRMAVMTIQGPLLVLAGAGSGKTTVLINRIANLIEFGCGSDSEYVPDNATEDDIAFLESYIKANRQPQHTLAANKQAESPPAFNRETIRRLCAVDPVPPWRIIAITFTNKAAGEMKRRLEKMLGPGSEDIWASTFHSACVRILRRDIDRLGYDKSFAIYDTSDTASLMKRILKELNVEERNLPHRTVLGYISRAKDAMTSAEVFLSSAESTGDVRRKLIGRAYLEYESRLKASNALDFDDLILKTVQLLKENTDILQYYQNKFKYVLIDEYQDTNNLQYLLAAALAGGHSNICVVGDDDQSIYKFRGATIENILNFEKQYSDARVIRLEQNYRSTGYILDAANDVIHNNKGRKGKKLWTENNRGFKPELHIVADERDEAQFVADTIIASVASGQNWSEHTVLYRMNAQSNQLETAFKRSGVPFRIIGGMGFYERAEIKDMLAYLCVIHNPGDDIRLLRIINNPPRGIGNTTIGRLVEIAAEMNCPVYEVINESHKRDELKASAGRLRIFADMIDELREFSASAPLDELYDALISRTGYIRMLEEKSSVENLARIENVRELKTNIISFMKESGGSLFDFLSETALFTDFDRDNQSTDRVQIMTMHSAKGLEFNTVFIVGAEEGIFPGARSIGQQDEIEEERRLCYVAMTRAMRRLYFLSAQSRMLFGKTSSAQPSRFLKEIRYDNIEVIEKRSKYRGFGFSAFSGSSGYGNDAWSRKYASNDATSSPASSASSASYSPITSSTSSASSSSHATLASPTISSSHASSASITSSASTTVSSSSAPPTTTVPRVSSGFKNQNAGKKTYQDQLPKLRKGDIIEHKVFKRGVIIGVAHVGGDSLLEIAFENVGTKRLLLKAAAKYITKVEIE